jgi:hypothetical protein
MSILHSEYCLSGSCPHPFEVTIRRMLQLDSVAQIVELLLWDQGGQVNRTTLARGSHATDMERLTGIDHEQLHKFHCVLEPCIAGVTTTIHVWACRDEDETLIEGQVFVQELLEHAASPEQSLIGLADLLARMAEHLHARFLHVADEDDDSLLVPDSTIRLPSLCGIYQRQAISAIIAPLRESGAVVEDAPHPDFLAVWVAPIESLMQDASPRAAVLELLRGQVMATWRHLAPPGATWQ